MGLHAFTAKTMKQIYPELQYMAVAAMPSMGSVITKTLPREQYRMEGDPGFQNLSSGRNGLDTSFEFDISTLIQLYDESR